MRSSSAWSVQRIALCFFATLAVKRTNIWARLKIASSLFMRQLTLVWKKERERTEVIKQNLRQVRRVHYSISETDRKSISFPLFVIVLEADDRIIGLRPMKNTWRVPIIKNKCVGVCVCARTRMARTGKEKKKSSPNSFSDNSYESDARW